MRATLGDAFPRLVVHLLDPDPRLHEPLASVAGEVFFGTVGPTMMLTPQDHRRLGLARFEIPGTVKVGEFGSARRALVRVRIPELEADATIPALVPAMPYEALVGFARWRNSWWQWGESIQPKLPETAPFRGSAGPPVPAPREAWILFGRDRILASGDSPSAALAGAASLGDVDYHRFLMRIPREERLTLREVDFAKEPRDVDLNGAKHPARPSTPGGPLLVTPEVGRALRLELAEDPRDLRLELDAKPGEPNLCGLRGGYAWERAPDPKDPGADDATPRARRLAGRLLRSDAARARRRTARRHDPTARLRGWGWSRSCGGATLTFARWVQSRHSTKSLGLRMSPDSRSHPSRPRRVRVDPQRTQAPSG